MSAVSIDSDRPVRLPCHALVAGVLIGGRSRRMGRPKALLRRGDGTTFLEHVVHTARSVVGEVVLLGRGPAVPPALRSMRVLADAAPDSGPLAGLCSLMEYAGERLSLLLACDLPNVHPPLLRKLYERMDATHAAAAFVRSDAPGVFHACCAVYSPRAIYVVRQSLATRELRMQCALARLPVARLTPTADEVRQLSNVNTPDQLAGVRMIASRL